MDDEHIRREHILDRIPSMRIGRNSNAPVLLLPTIAHDHTIHTSTYAPPTPPHQHLPVEERTTPSRRDYEVDEHKLSVAEVAFRYGTDLIIEVPESSAGLTVEEAAARLTRNGYNALTPPLTRSEYIKFLVHFLDPLILLLVLASILAFISFGLTKDVTNAILAGVLIVLVIFSSTMAYIQERRASDVINSIKQSLPSTAKVRRSGMELSIPASELVVGDIVHLTIGNRIPADIRITSSSDLKVEMSQITGESDAILCTPIKQSDLVAEARCVLFSTSLVMQGSCYGIVIRTGDEALIGCIAKLAGKETEGETTMEVELKRIVNLVVIFAIVTSISLFSIGMGRGLGFVFSFVNAFILVLIANVPEGLPATVAGLLNLTARDLASEKIYIKRVELIETLGSASVICTDKTGTLTTNVMTVQNLWLNRSFARAKGKIHRLYSGGANSISVNADSSSAVAAAAAAPSTSALNSRDHTESLAGLLFVSDANGDEDAHSRSVRQGQTIGRSMSFIHGEAMIHSTLQGRRRQIQAPSTIASFDLGTTGRSGEGEGESDESSGSDQPASESFISTTESAPPAVLLSLDRDVDPSSGDSIIGSEGGGDSPSHNADSLPLADTSSLPQTISPSLPPRSPLSPPPPPPPPPSARDAFAELNSFRSFSGLAHRANWRASNGFTRCATIAAVCNKANFASSSSSSESNPSLAISQNAAANTRHHSHNNPAAGDHSSSIRVNLNSNEISRFESFLSRRHPKGLRNPKDDIDRRIVLGDASDAALMRYADALTPIGHWRAAFPLLFEVPFNSETKWALVVTEVPENPQMHLSLMKGAPERVLDACSSYFDKGLERPIGIEFKNEWQKAYESFAVMGERVLAVAYLEFPACSTNQVEAKRLYADSTSSASVPRTGYVFLGLVSLVDPPKSGVKEAVKKCRTASIKVSMVTGDHPLTAEAIARKVGIITLPTAREVAALSGVLESEVHIEDPRVCAVVIPGYAIQHLSVSEWDCILNKEEVVFARTSPQQKLEIVENYQRLGHVVAVTGDGTNDAPALKKANIGVAMGSAESSDVAREAADVILLDDNFASIVVAIERGRTVFDNIKKTCAFTLTHMWPELIPVFLLMIFDIPLMLPTLLILVVDIITEQGPAISLTFEGPELSVMSRPPRNRSIEKLADTPLILYSYFFIGFAESLVCILAFFTVFISHGVPSNYVSYHRDLWQESSPTTDFGSGLVLTGPEQATIYHRGVSAYFLTLVLCQASHIWFTKTRLTSSFVHPVCKNHYTILGILVSLCVSVFCIYTPSVNSFFLAAPITIAQWTVFFIFAFFVLTWTETVKFFARRYKDDPNAIVHRYFAW
jgi:magnesium-transporting ATPase (P-type)